MKLLRELNGISVSLYPATENCCFLCHPTIIILKSIGRLHSLEFFVRYSVG